MNAPIIEKKGIGKRIIPNLEIKGKGVSESNVIECDDTDSDLSIDVTPCINRQL